MITMGNVKYLLVKIYVDNLIVYLYWLFSGFLCRSTNQISTLPWTVQLLSNQIVLHIKHPNHPTECTSV